MTTVSASKLRTHCHAILDRVGAEGIVITKRGKPIAKLLPVPQTSGHLIGCLKGKLKVNGDIVSPLYTRRSDR